jgi:ATP-dependent Clp protease ATP-binding subunit ClpB
MVGKAPLHLFCLKILDRLSKEILAGKINDGDRITLDYFEESGLVFRPVEK